MANSDWALVTLGDLIDIKHGFAFKGEFFRDNPTPDILLTPGNFAIGGGFKDDKLKYYAGPVPSDYMLEEGDLIVTMTDLSKDADWSDPSRPDRKESQKCDRLGTESGKGENG